MNIFTLDRLRVVIKKVPNFKSDPRIIEGNHQAWILLRALKVFPTESRDGVLKNELVYIDTRRHESYDFEFTGFFLLQEDSREKLRDFFSEIINQNFIFHITRADYALDLNIEYEKVLHFIYLKQKQEKLPTEVFYRSKNPKTKELEFSYYAGFSTVFSLNSYNKSAQLEQKGMEKYREMYFARKPNLKNKSISRIEIRIKNKRTCEKLTLKSEQGEDIFTLSSNDFFKEIRKRFTLIQELEQIIRGEAV